MKKWLSVILLLAITLGLCACGDTGEGSGETTPAEGLQIGYARESILPEGQVNMSGGGNQAQRVSTGYLDILYATCLAITENDTIISTCTNSYNNYFPTEKAYTYGCYESYTARYDTGVAEMAAENSWSF